MRITWSRTSLWSDLEETLNRSMLTDKGLLQNAHPKPKPHSGWRVHCSQHGLFPTKLLRGPAHLVAKSRAPSVLISLDPLDVSFLSCFHTCVPTAQFFPLFFPDHPFCSSDIYSLLTAFMCWWFQDLAAAPFSPPIPLPVAVPFQKLSTPESRAHSWPGQSQFLSGFLRKSTRQIF